MYRIIPVADRDETGVDVLVPWQLGRRPILGLLVFATWNGLVTGGVFWWVAG